MSSAEASPRGDCLGCGARAVGVAEAASLGVFSGISTRWQQRPGYQPVASKNNRPPLTSLSMKAAVVSKWIWLFLLVLRLENIVTVFSEKLFRFNHNQHKHNMASVLPGVSQQRLAGRNGALAQDAVTGLARGVILQVAFLLY